MKLPGRYKWNGSPLRYQSPSEAKAGDSFECEEWTTSPEMAFKLVGTFEGMVPENGGWLVSVGDAQHFDPDHTEFDNALEGLLND